MAWNISHKLAYTGIALLMSLGLAACSPSDEKTSPPDTMVSEEAEEMNGQAGMVDKFVPTRFQAHVYGEIAEQSSEYKPQIILLPGLASSPEVWNATRDQLENDFEVHVLHVNGFAGSQAGANAEPGALSALAAEVAAYAEQMDDPILIGHSMGGIVALMVALSHEDAVSKIMSVDVLPFFSVLINPMATEKNMVPAAEKARDEMLAQTDAEFEESQIAAMKRLSKSAEHAALTAEWTVTSDRAAVANIMYDVLTQDLRKEVSNIKIPATVVYAFDESAGFPKAAVAGVYQMNYANLKGVDLRMIEDARHYVMLDQPEAFAEEITRFVTSSQ